jgi:effector-binding domain-containing protein
MVVDLRVKHVAGCTVASMMRVGPYSANMLRSEFSQLAKWAKKRGLRTGKWILFFIDEPGGRRPANRLRSEACLQIKGRATSEGKIKVKKLPAQKVVAVTFNPNIISPRLVYSGIYGWLEWAGLKEAGLSREVYEGNPWTNPRAWANAEVQLPVKRRK